MDTVSGTVYHKSKKFPIYAGAESPANYTTASKSTQFHVTSFWRWLLITCITIILTTPTIHLLSPIISTSHSLRSPTLQAYRTAHQRRRRPSPPLPTLRNNGRSRWTGRSSEGRSVLVHLFSSASIRDGMADSFSLCGICAWLVAGFARIGHFDRGRTGWRSLSKIAIETTLSSFPSTPSRLDLNLDLIDDTHSHRLHESSRQPSSTTTFDAPPSSSPLLNPPAPHPIHPHRHPRLLLTFRATRWQRLRYASFCISSIYIHFVSLR